MAIDPIASGAGTSTLNGSRNTIAENFDTFLSLLTTQLRNQSPLDPMDTNQFTQQLVQFTSVEQQLKTNEFLEALVLSNQATTYTDTVSFIGREVTASGAATQLKDGEATWTYTADRDAAEVTITIRDADGNTVYTEEGSLAGGEGAFTWDGASSTGQQMPEGQYSITIDARDTDGAHVPVSTETTGIVEAVDLSGVEPVLIVDGARVNLSSVRSVRALT